MKILALDIGDVWTGVAISDALGITTRPYSTVKTADLETKLERIIEEEPIKTIIVGHPKTMRGTKSAQTIKIEEHAKKLEKQFPAVSWILWDERLSSKHAERLMRPKTKEQKLESHAVAAALFLMSYLDSLKFQ